MILGRIMTFSSVQSLSRVRLFVTPWTTAHQASLSITNSRSSPRSMSIESVIQPSHPLSSHFPPALNLSQHLGLFKWVSSLHQMAKGLEYQLQHQSFQWIQWKEFHFLSNVSPHFTSHSRMYGFRWVITPLWSSGLSGSFLDSSSVYSCHLFLVLSLFGIKYGVERCGWAQSWQELDF